MKFRILIAAIFFALCASGQSDTVLKQRVQRILKEYTHNFKGFIGGQKLSGVPKRLFVNPGLQGSIDELDIWGDTIFVYSSRIVEQSDSSFTRRKVSWLDEQLQSALGRQFTREVVNLSFSEEQEVPLAFKSTTIKVYVTVGKFKQNEYMTLLAFKGRGLKRKKLPKPMRTTDLLFHRCCEIK